MIPKGPYMDMHTHILPGIDDGSQTIEQTSNMLMTAYEEGIRVIVATPHFGIRNPGITIDKAKKALELAQQRADEITPGLKILLGAELFYSDGIIDSLDRGECPTMGGTSFALVEFSTRDSKERINKCIQEMLWKGYKPIIAHIERYRSLEGDIEAVRDFVNRGVAVQINCRTFMDGAPSKQAAEGSKETDAKESSSRKKGLLGLFGKAEKQTNRAEFFLEQKGDWARMLLAEGLVHFIASDCHDDQHRSPIYRTALEAMDGCCSDKALEDIAKINILKLIRNERIV